VKRNREKWWERRRMRGNWGEMEGEEEEEMGKKRKEEWE